MGDAASNAHVVREIFAAFARKEGFALRGLFADDAVWTVPGRGVMAGVYEGRALPGRSVTDIGSRTLNVEPRPSSLFTEMLPPISSAKRRLSASPRPVPP